MDIDMLSLSGHKFHAPQGRGRAVYHARACASNASSTAARRSAASRAGTENVAGIVGMGKAIELATANIDGTSGAHDRACATS